MPNAPWRSATKISLIAGVLLALAAGTADAQDSPSNGGDVLRSGGGVLAQADSQVAAVVPYAGGTSLPVKIGIAGARIDDSVATASAGATDFGLLGTLGTLAIVGSPTLQRLGVPTGSLAAFHLPSPVTADSRTTTEAEGTPVFPKVNAGPLQLRGGFEHATAAENGPAHGRVELGALSVDLGIVSITTSGGVSETSATPTEIRATTSIGELRFDASGASPVLRGIEWRLVQQIGRPAVTSFSIGSAEIGPTRYAFNSPEQVLTAFSALNKVLGRTGLSITPPTATAGALSPLHIKLKDSQLAAKFVQPLYGGLLANAVNQVESTLVSGLPESGLGITVANVGLAALTGRGGVGLELGGISGNIGHRPVEEFHYGSVDQQRSTPDLAALGTNLDENSSALSTSDVLPIASTPSGGAPLRESDSSPVAHPILQAVAEKAPATVVLLGALAALATVAALDRRRLAAYLAAGGRV